MMRIISKNKLMAGVICLLGLCTALYNCTGSKQPALTEVQDNEKVIIYQIMTRLFGNTNTTNKHYGSIEENGVGKFNDIDNNALKAIRDMGFNHVWYTGVIEHATMTDYSGHGISLDDPDVVKGRAGSPYAIKDYYDVNPDLAVDVNKRMEEFQQLVARTHDNGMKVLIDFVPNHVARSYKSDAKPGTISDLGETDDVTKAFDPNNNFYYIPGKSFVAPKGYNPGGNNLKNSLKDGKFSENPAKATGNDVFSEAPSIDDWFETVKLNYGVDYLDGRKTYFDSIPNTWLKMTDILLYWAGKGVDGFRCDMCEMVPVEFWDYAIGKVKEQYPDIVFMGEAYNQNDYHKYIEDAKFDILYDKVGLYDSLKVVIRDEGNVGLISKALNNPNTQGIQQNMLHFLENHDEQRIASPDFAGNASKGIPMMVVSATLTDGPVMVYFGQEVGTSGSGNEGFGGEDGRTTIFDYWGVPEFQAWVNDKKYDGGKLNKEQKQLREFYATLLNAIKNEPAIQSHNIYELQEAYGTLDGYNADRLYSYARYVDNDLILCINSFTNDNSKAGFYITDDLFGLAKMNKDAEYQVTDLLNPAYTLSVKGSDLLQSGTGLAIDIPAYTSSLLKIIPKQ